MRLSEKSVKSLRILLKERFGLDYTDEQAQEAGMAIIRYMTVKAQREQDLTNYKEYENGQEPGNYGTTK